MTPPNPTHRHTDSPIASRFKTLTNRPTHHINEQSPFGGVWSLQLRGCFPLGKSVGQGSQGMPPAGRVFPPREKRRVAGKLGLRAIRVTSSLPGNPKEKGHNLPSSSQVNCTFPDIECPCAGITCTCYPYLCGVREWWCEACVAVSCCGGVARRVREDPAWVALLRDGEKTLWYHTHHEVGVDKSEEENETVRYGQEFLQVGCAQRRECVFMRVLARSHRVRIAIVTFAAAVLTRIGVVPMSATTTAAALDQNGVSVPGALSSRLGDNDTVTKTITVGSYPYEVAVTPNGSTAYVTNYNSGSVSVIDTVTGTVTKTITVGSYPVGGAVTPDGSTVYVTNRASGSVSRIDTATGTVTKTITVGGQPGGVVVTPDGSTVYVTNRASGSVSVIDTATGTVTKTITVGTNPVGVAVAPDGSTVYVTTQGSDSVSVIDRATGTVTKTITVGTNPVGVAVAPDGSTVYVPNQGSDSVSVIDTATGTVTKTITVGTNPVGVAVAPDGSTVYVVNLTSGSVSVIDRATGTVTKTITVGTDSFGVAV